MQSVCIVGVMLDFLPVTRGIAQGSVPGRVVFLMFTNDDAWLNQMLMHLFADDVQLYKVLMNAALVNSINKINRLELNDKKSKGLVIGVGTIGYNPLVRLNDVTLFLFTAKSENWVSSSIIISSGETMLNHSRVFT